jgi:uncharacterized protein (TIGR02600 family)
MNSSEPNGKRIQKTPGKWRQRKGVALILVVSFIVLLSALVVGFFSRVTTDLSGARSYAEGVSSRQLAESAVSVVMGQIRAATTITNGCWASQPGMIRVYGGNNGAAGSQAYRFYKLYSSHNLVVTDFSSFNPKNTSPSQGGNAEVPIGTGGWSDQPAFFTDLNEPVSVNATDPNTGQTVINKRYPILDPSVARIQALGQNTSSSSTSNYVEGLEVNLTDQKTLQINNAPMPVRWIYVLRDGTLTAPTPLSGSAAGNAGLKATWSAVSTTATPSTGVPTKENPIVGRIAFWTDDDTCKVNINTAGGYIADEGIGAINYSSSNKQLVETNPAFIAGSFWDTPRVQTYFDRGISGKPQTEPTGPYYRPGLASSQPVRNEFQRYPGHPATTSLGLVLKGLLPVSLTVTGGKFDSEILYQMTPRLSQGLLTPASKPQNSMGGSKQLVAYEMKLDPSVYPLDSDPPAVIKKTFDPAVAYNVSNPKTYSYHLWSSVDEMYYATGNNPTVTNSNGTRTTAEAELKLPKNAITPQLIDASRFLLTAHSRSPELNLFGRPRVSIWPVPTPLGEGLLLTSAKDPDTGKLGIHNPSDDLMRFCSTVGADSTVNNPSRPGQFIFDREDPYSATTDFNRQRNREIFSYLQDVTSNNNGRIPGYGQSFQGKYTGTPGAQTQILTEIFDYIRTVNLKDTSRDERIDRSQGRTSVTQAKNTNAETLKGYARYAKRGIVVPTKTNYGGNPIAGFGRFPTITEVSLVFYHGGYIYKDKKTGVEVATPEYNYKQIDDRNFVTGNATDRWFQNNDLVAQLMRAFLVVETFNPMQGYGPVTNFDNSNTAKERVVYEITTPPPFKVKSKSMTAPQSLNLGTGQNHVWLSSGQNTWGGRNFGGTEGFFHTLQGKTSSNPAVNTPNTTTYYPFQTPCLNAKDGIRVGLDDTEFDFTGGQMTLNIRYMDNAHNNLPAHNELIQTLQLTWPNGTAWPVPITEREAGRWRDPTVPNPSWRTQLIASYGGVTKYSGEGFRQDTGGFDPQEGTGTWNCDAADAFGGNRWSTNGGYSMPYSLPLRINWAQKHSHAPWTKFNNDTPPKQVGDGYNYANRFLQILQPGDTIRSLIPGGTTSEATDPRTTHLQRVVTNFKPHPDYNKQDPNPNLKRRAQTLRRGDGGFYFNPTDLVWFGPKEADQPTTGLLASLPGGTRYLGYVPYLPSTLRLFDYISSGPDLPKGVVAKQANARAADFDTGIGNFPDGAFTGKADEGNLSRSWIDEWNVWHYVEPYFSTWTYDPPGDTYFSPNRQIPSPVMFGSLLAPQTTLDKAGWKTLLFCPNPAAGFTSTEHQGFANPPDHLLLDLFTMPVVEPYAISEPFSTDGKVNLNFQMMPFGYIERSTALRAALQPLRVTAIPSAFTRTIGAVKELRYKGINNDENLRYLVDRDETVKGFNAIFDQYSTGSPGKGFFKSASQICEMFLYPKGQPYNYGLIKFTSGDSSIKSWWNTCSVTGDNVREKPYSDLYSRITTKSNTYTVHYRVQSLRQRPYTGNPSGEAAYYMTWDESRDQVLSEYRGHTTIERYLDPRDDRFYKTINPDKDSLESAYRFRVIYNKRFSPW